MSYNRISNHTLSDKITDALRAQILLGSLPAGAPLRQEKLAEEFGVSMSSLREALRTLHAEGLVAMLPRKGAMVKDLSAKEAEELFEIRAFLEVGALELAMPHITQEHCDKAKDILLKIDETQDVLQWADLNYQFHEALYAAAEKETLLSLVRILHNNVARYMHLYLDTLNRLSLSQGEHWKILEACQRKDLAEAQATLRLHLKQAQERLGMYLLSRAKE